MDWFNYLKEQDFFNPENNPAPIQDASGYKIPSWEVLDYLVTIASKFKNGGNLELIPEILNIIKNVSEKPVDNYYTWSKFIEILSLIPNEYVTDEFLDYIPIYVISQFDTLLQTAEVTDSLLPKFLTETKNSKDLEKAERIISHLLTVRLFDSLEDLDKIVTFRYGSPFYLYKLNEAFHDKQILNEIINICSSKPLYYLIHQINFLLRDNVVIADGDLHDVKYTFKVYRVFEDIIVRLEKLNEGNIETVDSVIYKNYMNLDENWFNSFLRDLFDKHSIDKSIYDSVFERLSFGLWNDFTSLVGYEGFKDLEQDSHYHNITLGVFSYILREWLVGLVKVDNNKLKVVLEDFITKNEYNLPYYKRLLLYVVEQDWDNLKFLFWKLVEEETNVKLFSNFAYRLELHYLLSKVSKDLDGEEEELLFKIIENGPLGEKHYTSTKEEWQHRWLDALQENAFFATKYKILNDKFKLSKDYSDEGKFVVRVGHVAPYTIEEILAMDDKEVVLNVENFQSTGGWDDPTIEGFADFLGQAVEQEPERFSNFIKMFLYAKYIYVDNILSAFSNAWKANKVFNWENVLNFSFLYITSEAFLEDKLKANDYSNANKNWIYGTISRLITDGTQNDNHSFSNELLPLCKKILLHIFQELPKSDFSSKEDKDLIIYSLNSTQGRLLIAILNYSLKLSRNSSTENQKKKWDREIKNLFEKSFNEFIDPYVLIAKHIPQFMYLDEEWLREKLVFINGVDDMKWLAFMEGLTFGKPLNKDYYNLLYPSYQRAVDLHVNVGRYNHGVIRHFLAYYFWNYEEDFNDTLLYKMLKSPTVETLASMIQLLIKQKSIVADNLPDKDILLQKIYKIWSLINASIESISGKEDLKILENIIHLTIFIEQLNEKNIVLVEENLVKFQSDVNTMRLIEVMSHWMTNSPPELIGRIVNKMSIKYVYDRQKLIELITFLYEGGQNLVADQVVNKLTMDGYDFLKPIYLRFNQ